MLEASFEFCRGVICALFPNLHHDQSGSAASKLHECAKEYYRRIKEGGWSTTTENEVIFKSKVLKAFGFDDQDPFKIPDTRLRRAWNTVTDYILGSSFDQAVDNLAKVL